MSQSKQAPQDAPDIYAQTIQAIIIVVAGWSCFAFADVASKILTQSYSVAQVLCLGNLLGTLIVGIWIGLKYGLNGFKSKKMKWHILRGLCVTCTSFCVVNAFARIPLADFYGIVFLSPMVLAIFSALFLKERIGLHRAIAIVAGFCGVLVLAGPQFGAMNAGILFALISVIFIASNGIIVRKIGKEPVILIFAFYPFLFSMIFNAPMMMADFTPVAMHDFWLFALLSPLLIGGVVGFAVGFGKAPETAVVAPFHYTQILWGVIFGYYLFGDVPTQATITGAGIIISAGLYLIWREHIAHKQKKTMAPLTR